MNQRQKGQFPWQRSNMLSSGQLYENNCSPNVGKAHSSEGSILQHEEELCDKYIYLSLFSVISWNRSHIMHKTSVEVSWSLTGVVGFVFCFFVLYNFLLGFSIKYIKHKPKRQRTDNNNNNNNKNKKQKRQNNKKLGFVGFIEPADAEKAWLRWTCSVVYLWWLKSLTLLFGDKQQERPLSSSYCQ